MQLKRFFLRSGAALMVAAVALTGSSVGAQDEVAEIPHDEAYFQKHFARLSTMAAELTAADTVRIATKEIQTISTLIGQGQAFLANERLDKIDFLIDRADALVSLIRVKFRRHNLDVQAGQAETEAEAEEKVAAAAKAAADTVEARYNELDKEGL